MNEVVVLNDPEYSDHGLECRMIGAEICNDERGPCIAVEIIVGGQTNQYRFHDVYEFMRMWRLADSVVLPEPWEPAHMEQILTSLTNEANDIQGKVKEIKEVKSLNNLYDVSAVENTEETQ